MIISKKLLIETNTTQLTYEILKSQKYGKLTKKSVFQFKIFCKKCVKIILKNYNIFIDVDDFLFFYECALICCIDNYKRYKYELNKRAEIYFMSLITRTILLKRIRQNDLVIKEIF